MPFAPHIRMTALGRIAGSGERFSYGLAIGNTQSSAPGLSANEDVWDDMAEDLRSFHAHLDTQIHPAAILEEVKFARIGADGKYTADPYIANVVDTPGGGGYTPRALVTPQSACAVSFTTNRRGASGKGRFYLPMPVVPVDQNTFLVELPYAEAIRNRTVQLIDNLNNAPGIDVLGLEVVVASSKGFNTRVDGVRVGRVVDTVRSRRSSISENYTATTLVAVDE